MIFNCYPDTLLKGQIILPLQRIQLFSPKEWEDFITEWVYCIKKINGYEEIESVGGSGDMGIDVKGITKDPSIWDNYQCKHYKDPLKPSDVWVEFGKIVFYSFQKKYKFPRNYFFVSPKGVGTKLSSLLKDSIKLKEELKSNWNQYCKNQITDTHKIEMTNDLEEYLNSLDFSIFKYIPPLEIIEQHKKSTNHINRFGGGLPDRPRVEEPPKNIQEKELNYTKKLIKAYEDHLKRSFNCINEIPDDNIKGHFFDSRKEFFSAEALRAFSRDSLPSGAFEELQEQFLDGIKDEVRKKYNDGYEKVLEVIKAARRLIITNNGLINRMNVKDRGGICHQLANEKEEIVWVSR